MNIDINADVGEGADDAPLYPIVSSVNIACGAHAGNDDTMARAIELALKHPVSIGAHPGYPDRQNLGRKPLEMHKAELRQSIRHQIARLRSIAAGRGATIMHVKPHGALYNEAAGDPWLAATVADAVGSLKPKPRLIALSGSWLAAAGRSATLLVAEEGFADRRYRRDGTLAPRDTPGALITDPVSAAEQALAIARGAPIEPVDGSSVTIHASSICVHADTPGAVESARAVRAALEQAGFTIAPL
ncbi:MAG TPA: 5-oxoprolinase subunit PxpA [Actinomycetota bacterium]|nr:5-oxoprolinase subunit PxpA [Actinomycetota bacterium]